MKLFRTRKARINKSRLKWPFATLMNLFNLAPRSIGTHICFPPGTRVSTQGETRKGRLWRRKRSMRKKRSMRRTGYPWINLWHGRQFDWIHNIDKVILSSQKISNSWSGLSLNRKFIQMNKMDLNPIDFIFDFYQLNGTLHLQKRKPTQATAAGKSTVASKGAREATRKILGEAARKATWTLTPAKRLPGAHSLELRQQRQQGEQERGQPLWIKGQWR